MRKYDILYIHSTKNPIDDSITDYAIMPMGIIGILNSLETKGISIIGMNMSIEKYLNPEFDLASYLKNTDYKILITDLHWYEHSYGAMYVLETSKSIHPDIPTIIGGYTSSIYSDEIMTHFQAVDYVVTGDSDYPMEQLVSFLLGQNDIDIASVPNLFYRHNASIMKSKYTWTQDTLEHIDFINTDFIEHKEYIPYLTTKGVSQTASSQWICIARGCEFNCSFCCGANANMETLFHRKKILLRSPKKTATDFCALHSQGITFVNPSHDFQMFGKNYYQEVFSEIRKKQMKPGLYLECFQLPTKDYIDNIAETFDPNHILLVISPISGNEMLRRENGKFFTNDELYERVSYILSKNMNIQLYYTLNLVKETEEQFMDTYFQMMYFRTVMNLTNSHILYQRVVIDPLARLRKFDHINVSYNSFMDYYHYCKLPNDKKNIATGFEDHGALTSDEKMKYYHSVFS